MASAALEDAPVRADDLRLAVKLAIFPRSRYPFCLSLSLVHIVQFQVSITSFCKFDSFWNIMSLSLSCLWFSLMGIAVNLWNWCTHACLHSFIYAYIQALHHFFYSRMFTQHFSLRLTSPPPLFQILIHTYSSPLPSPSFLQSIFLVLILSSSLSLSLPFLSYLSLSLPFLSYLSLSLPSSLLTLILIHFYFLLFPFLSLILPHSLSLSSSSSPSFPFTYPRFRDQNPEEMMPPPPPPPKSAPQPEQAVDNETKDNEDEEQEDQDDDKEVCTCTFIVRAQL